jgi:hypothetical protein
MDLAEIRFIRLVVVKFSEKRCVSLLVRALYNY